MAGMCGNGQRVAGTLTFRVSGRILTVCNGVRIGMGDVYPMSGPSYSEAPDIIHFSSVDIDQARSVLNRFYYPVAVGAPEGSADFGLGMEVIQLGPLTV